MGQRSTSARGLLCAGALVLALTWSPSAGDAALTAGVGADYYAGPEGQSVRDVLGYVGTSLKRSDLTLAVARYDHSHLGPGTSVSALGSFTVAPTVLLQLSATRTVGSNDYRAWRLAMGPMLAVGQGRWLALTLSRSEEIYGPSMTGLTSELGIPLSAKVAGSARASLASVEGGGTSFLGSAGVVWSPARRVQLFGELGVGRDVIALGGLSGAPGAPSQAGLGPDYVSGPSILTGVRFAIR
jgi:hypothetical protein